MEQLHVAIIGQGRSGRNIHGHFFKSENNKAFQVAAVVDKDETRRKRAAEEYPGCEVFESHTELYEKKNIDLVINSTFSNEHYAITKDLLEHGFHVVVEKPFARSRYECDNLIKTARENNVVLGVFQQSFFAPFYRKAKEVIASGVLGKIMQIDITYSSLSRRWDWQTTQVKMGGNIYNTGPHPIGFALGFLDFDENCRVVFSKLDHVLSSGDADDYAKIILTAPNKPVIDVEISSNDAYPADHIKILGSKGTYKSTISSYEMKYIIDGDNPEQKLVLDSMKDENDFPVYCHENLITHEEKGKFDGSAFDVGTMRFYEMMYNKITNNEKMAVTPEHAAMIISVIEQAHAQNPLPVKF
ncbi:MAG: Gfo/Idh/MocA family oxidoreductase [Clostridia bacterium]|nr:Gfo/Idh/MocA family oxidoreductase [Clostridia bacterium]